MHKLDDIECLPYSLTMVFSWYFKEKHYYVQANIAPCWKTKQKIAFIWYNAPQQQQQQQ